MHSNLTELNPVSDIYYLLRLGAFRFLFNKIIVQAGRLVNYLFIIDNVNKLSDNYKII